MVVVSTSKNHKNYNILGFQNSKPKSDQLKMKQNNSTKLLGYPFLRNYRCVWTCRQLLTPSSVFSQFLGFLVGNSPRKRRAKQKPMLQFFRLRHMMQHLPPLHQHPQRRTPFHMYGTPILIGRHVSKNHTQSKIICIVFCFVIVDI